MKSVRVDNVPPVVMELIASHCTHLTYFECRNISSGDNFGFRNILLRNPHLEELMLVGLPQAELDGVSLPKLHSIELHNCAFVNDQSVLSLVKLSSKITRLCLNGGESVSRATLTKLAAQLPLLQALDISNCQKCDSAALSAFTKACPLITDLVIYENKKVTDAGLKQALLNLQNLRVLDIQACASLTDQALVYIALHAASTLEVLYIGDGMSFSVSAVSWMLSMCLKIRTLVWTAEAGIACNEVDLKRAFTNLRNVKTLMLGDGICCDAALKMVGEHCTQLQNLNFYYNAPDEDSEDEYLLPHSAEGVFAVAQGCTMLRKVVCGQDNEVLNELAQKFWKLQNPQITFSSDNDPFCSSIMRVPL